MQYQSDRENDLSNFTETPTEEFFDPDININFIIPEEDLKNTVIDDRFVIGDIIATGHIGTIRMGKNTKLIVSYIIVQITINPFIRRRQNDWIGSRDQVIPTRCKC